MADTSLNNKRIVKNTAYLYLRMLLTAFVSLYVARVVLKVLGSEDFGIFNVVGGIVTFMGFITASLSSATQRYFAFHLGKSDEEGYRNTYSLLINVYIAFCGIVLIALEIIGPYYISNYMTLSVDRINAAHIVFQLSLLSFIITTITIPHRSSVIAYEKMDVFSYITILEVLLQLLIAIGLTYSGYDHLILYSVLMTVSAFIIALAFIFYCKYRLSYCKYHCYWNTKYFKELSTYSGWNLFGSITGVMNIQGQAIVLNSFFGPVVNAAKAIADRVNGMISQFSTNFYLAVAPQIIKSYAVGDIEYMRKIVLNSSRYSFFLLYAVSIPIYLGIDIILDLWLGNEQVTMEMIKFCQYTIVYMLVNVLEQPITMAVRATGNIKKYQIVVGSITLSFIPFCILIFLFGVPAYTSVLLLAVIYSIAHVARVIIVSPILKISPLFYFKMVGLPIIETIIIPLVVYVLIVNMMDSYNVFIKIAIICIAAILSISFVGINKEERSIFVSFIKNRIR